MRSQWWAGGEGVNLLSLLKRTISSLKEKVDVSYSQEVNGVARETQSSGAVRPQQLAGTAP